jgi:glycosyltransferase involved in cell wall biosynthesis
MNLPRVLIIIEYPTRSGGENSLLAILKQLANHVDLMFLLPDESPLLPELVTLGINYCHYQLIKGDTQANQSIRYTALKTLLQEFDPHIIHGNSLSMGKFLGRGFTQLKPAIVTAHIRDIIKLSLAEVAALNQLDHLICVSHATRQHMIKQGINPTSITVIHNGIDPAWKFNPELLTRPKASIRDELGLPPTAKLALFIGQLGLRKGVNHLLEAFSSLTNISAFVPWHLLLVGSRYSNKNESIEYEQSLHRFTKAHRLEQRIHFLGYRSDIPQIMAESDLLVHPALQEPLGRVLLEAGVSQLPIVATDVGGTREIIEHGVTGLLVEPGSPHAIADAWKSLLDNPQFMHDMADASYHKVSCQFTTAPSAHALLNLWKNLLEK